MSFTGLAGGAVGLPGNGCCLVAVARGDVVVMVSDGSVVVQRAVLHMTITIMRSISLFTVFTSQDEIGFYVYFIV